MDKRATEASELTISGALFGHRLRIQLPCLDVLQFSNRMSSETDYTSNSPRDDVPLDQTEEESQGGRRL